MKVISLFSNIGIAETYLQDIGFKVLLANDICERRTNLYSKFYPETNSLCGDFSDPDFFKTMVSRSKDIKPDIVIATPPCQGMSTAGEQKKHDFRNNLTANFVEYIKAVKPKYIFFENVPLFMKTKILVRNKEVFLKDYLIDQLNPNYKISAKIVDMSKHNIPQKRVRAIFLMTRKDINRDWVLPKESDSIQTLEETIGFLPSLDPWIKDASEKENLQFFPRFEEKRQKGLEYSQWHTPPQHLKRHVIAMMHTPTGKTAFENKKHKPKKVNGDIVRGYKNTYKRQSWDKTGYTITMDNVKVSSQENVHPGRYLKTDKQGIKTFSDPRVLSLYELMLVSTLPKNWAIPSETSEAFLRRLIGEGIPPLFVKNIFNQLL
jgi:DNA (cytosine-5)-methyltransferase 1